jgi:hypothetical protein
MLAYWLMKYLIAGLGNYGEKYARTRHNIGFMILDALAGASNISFQDRRYGFVAEYRYRSRICILLKPTTYVNLSGRAVNYWLRKGKDTAGESFRNSRRPCPAFRNDPDKGQGGDGGHNGLFNISQVLGTQDYSASLWDRGGFSQGRAGRLCPWRTKQPRRENASRTDRKGDRCYSKLCYDRDRENNEPL